MEDFDDDFGELYADVEVHRISATDGVPDFARLYIEPEVDDGSDDTKSEDAKLKEDIVSDAMKVDAACGELTRSGGGVSETNDEKEANDDYIGSDSEDDLNIVLNDEDCPCFPVGGVRNEGVVRGVGYDENDSDEAIGLTDGSNLGKNGKCGDQLADGAELVSSNGLGVHNRSGLKGGYKSQFFHHKYVRRGSALVNNTKVNKSRGLVSYLSHFTKDGRNGNSSIQKQVPSSSHIAHIHAAANPMTVQCGYGLYLPWHWSIFDVNIDTLEEKPWRTPGVDITDYFNFGFDESSWKHYCASLEQLLEASMQTGSAVNESSKISLDAMREQTEQAVSRSSLSPSIGCELPKGRAIQVEESMFERQPSMDVRRPRIRDSDVVIQIKVLESSDGYSGSGNGNVLELSEEGEFCAGNNINSPGSVSEHDNELSQEPLEDVKNSEDSSTEERKDPVPGVDKNERQDQIEKRSEDTAEASEDELKAEEAIDLGTCTTDQCLIESQLSFGDQDLSLTSYSDSESENSVHADNEMRHSQRRQLEKSTGDLKESAPSDRKIPKDSSFNRKQENMDYYSRKRGPIRQEWRPLSHIHNPGSKLHKVGEKYDVFSKPMSGAREMSLDHEFFNYGRKNIQLQDYGGHRRRDVSCYEEIEQSYRYDDEKVVDDMVHTRYWYREDLDSFREHTNRDVRRDWDEKDYVFEHRTAKKDDDNEQDWYHTDGGYSVDELSPLSCRETRKFMSKRCSFPAKERNIQRRRKHGKSYLRDRSSDKDNWFNECGFDFIDRSYTTSIEREMESLDSKYEHRFLEPERSVRRARHHVRPSLELNSLWSGRIEDECQEYTGHRTSNLPYCRQFYPDSQKNYVYDTGVSEYLRGRERCRHTRDGRGSDLYCNNIDASKDEDFIFDPEKECDLGSRRYSSPSEVLDWVGDDVILRHHDKFDADDETFFYEETSWHKGTHARYESLHDEMEIDDIQLQHDYLHMPRRGSNNCVERRYKITCRDKHGQAKCWNSIDFVKGDGKFHGRSSRTRSLMCSGRIENLDQGIAKKRTTCIGLYKSHNEKAAKLESVHNGRKRLHSILDKEHKGLAIEEGQMVTEEPCMVASMQRRDLSEGEALTSSEKKRMLHNENNSDRDNNIGGYDNQKILETLAKMEKRRERFKEPIALKKEEEKSLKPDDDNSLIVGTDETKQLRPLRKRRWGGN